MESPEPLTRRRDAEQWSPQLRPPWFASYDGATLRSDVIAGATLGRVPRPCRDRRRFARRIAAGSGTLLLLVRGARILAVLQLSSHRRLGDVRDFTADWLNARRPRRRRRVAVRRLSVRYGLAGRGDRSRSRGWSAPAPSCGSSPKASWWGSNAASHCFSPARSCRNSSASTGRTATFGRMPLISSKNLKETNAVALGVGIAALAAILSGQGISQAQAGGPASW